MLCVQFEARLNELLDARIAFEEDADLCAHAEACAACAERMAEYETLVDSVGHFSAGNPARVEASGEQTRRVVAAIREQASGRRPQAKSAEQTSRVAAAIQMECEGEAAISVRLASPANRRRIAVWGWLALGGAAALLLAVVPWVGRGPEVAVAPGNPSGGENRASSALKPASGVSVVDKQEQGAAVRPDASAADRSPVELATDRNIGKMAEERIAWVGYRMADGLKPVAESMVNALNALRRRSAPRSDDPGRSSQLRFGDEASSA